MTRAEAISEWTFRSNHIKEWLDENGEEPSIRHYVELIDLAIEALQREEAEEKGYCHRIKPKWNCTANFVAEQLERLKNMTDEERLKLLHTLFPSAESVVRCKDCRHRCKEPIYSKADVHWVIYQIGDCPIICKTVGDDDYCSFGERND